MGEIEPKFIDTVLNNPLLSFSNDDLDAMNEDVNEMFETDSSDDESVDLGMEEVFFFLLSSSSIQRINSICKF